MEELSAGPFNGAGRRQGVIALLLRIPDDLFLRMFLLYVAWSQSRLGALAWPSILDEYYCVCSGGLAYALRLFISATHPGLLLKIFGYGAVLYISIPNYGLLDESTLPEKELSRHVLIKAVPFFACILASVAPAIAGSAN
jgi:hypothetical protein